MQYRQCLVLVLITLCFASPSRAEDDYAFRTDRATKNHYFIFKSSRGDVRFNHDMHQDVMEPKSCLPCHKTESPTKGHTMTRFDQRYAHAFCKGCHTDNNRGPVKCHECHKENK